jgi:thiol:disulfide interchange protein
VDVRACVNVKMEIVMNNLTQDKLDKIFKDGKNISDKPIYIDFYADW